MDWAVCTGADGGVGSDALGGVLAFHPLADEFDKFGGREWLEAESDVQSFVFDLSVGEATEYDDGDVISAGAEAADEIGTTRSGHDVIGNHETEVMASGTQQDQGTFGRGGDGYGETGIAKDRLADLQLNGVVVNEEDLTQTRTPEAIKGFRGREARFGPEFSSFRPIVNKGWRAEFQRPHTIPPATLRGSEARDESF